MPLGKEVRVEERKGSAAGCSWEEEWKLGPSSWGFYLSLEGGNLRGRLRGGFQQTSSAFQVCPFRVLASSGCSVPGQGGPSSLQLVLASPTWVCCFPGPGAETKLRPWCHLWGGDLLYLTVNCSASLLSCLSQFPYSTCQGIFLVFYHPISEGSTEEYSEQCREQRKYCISVIIDCYISFSSLKLVSVVLFYCLAQCRRHGNRWVVTKSWGEGEGLRGNARRLGTKDT